MNFKHYVYIGVLIGSLPAAFCGQSALDTKESKTAVHDTLQVVTPTIQYQSIDGKASKSTVSDELNEQLDQAQKYTASLLGQLNAKKKEIQKARLSSLTQAVNVNLSNNLSIAYDQIDQQYNQRICEIMMLLIFADENNEIGNLSAANNKLFINYFSYNYLDKIIPYAAITHNWPLIHKILCNKKLQSYIAPSAVNTLFLIAVFQDMPVIRNDILTYPALTALLTTTTAGYAYTCAQKRNNVELIKSFEANQTFGTLFRTYQQDVITTKELLQEAEAARKQCTNDRERTQVDANFEESLMTHHTADDLSTVEDDVDLEVLAAHLHLLDFS